MSNVIYLIKFAPGFIAALILGNWLFKEIKKARTLGQPWYKPYLTPPGVLIFVILAALTGIRIIMF